MAKYFHATWLKQFLLRQGWQTCFLGGPPNGGGKRNDTIQIPEGSGSLSSPLDNPFLIIRQGLFSQ